MANKGLTVRQKKMFQLGVAALKPHRVNKAAWKRWDDTREDRKSDKYIYLVRCNGYYKIGTSYSPYSRLNGMITSTPYDLQLVYATKLKDAVYMEHLIHNVLWKAKWVRGEWYSPDKKDFKRLTKFLNYVQGISYGDK